MFNPREYKAKRSVNPKVSEYFSFSYKTYILEEPKDGILGLYSVFRIYSFLGLRSQPGIY
jgi:hypothetical protein